MSECDEYKNQSDEKAGDFQDALWEYGRLQDEINTTAFAATRDITWTYVDFFTGDWLDAVKDWLDAKEAEQNLERLVEKAEDDLEDLLEDYQDWLNSYLLWCICVWNTPPEPPIIR
jgi:hypothetical protein